MQHVLSATGLFAIAQGGYDSSGGSARAWSSPCSLKGGAGHPPGSAACAQGPSATTTKRPRELPGRGEGCMGAESSKSACLCKYLEESICQGHSTCCGWSLS